MIYSILIYFFMLFNIVWLWFSGTPWPVLSFSIQEPTAALVTVRGAVYPAVMEFISLDSSRSGGLK